MRKLIVLMILASGASASHQQTFTVSQVGVSDNTGTVFFNTLESASGSECGNKNQFKVTLDNRIANKVYSAALMALASQKKLTVYYESNNCVGSAAKVNIVIVNE